MRSIFQYIVKKQKRDATKQITRVYINALTKEPTSYFLREIYSGHCVRNELPCAVSIDPDSTALFRDCVVARCYYRGAL